MQPTHIKLRGILPHLKKLRKEGKMSAKDYAYSLKGKKSALVRYAIAKSKDVYL